MALTMRKRRRKFGVKKSRPVKAKVVKPPKEPKVPWTLRLPREVNRQLSLLARAAKRSKNKQVEFLIESAFERAFPSEREDMEQPSENDD